MVAEVSLPRQTLIKLSGFLISNLFMAIFHTIPLPSVGLSLSQLQSAGSVFFVEDEEIDFDRVLREDKIALPKGVSWTAHWLAVEGVQPLIPENPPAIPRDADDSALKDSDATKVNGTGTAVNTVNGTTALPLGPTGNLPGGQKPTTQRPNQQNQPLVKQVLSRELQLYYARLTGALLPPSSDFSKRTGALASLRNDAGLQALLPYLVRWLGEGVVGVLKNGSQESSEGRVLEILLDVVAAILDNTTLFVEPYLHQILPPILSILLHSSLPQSHATQLRTTASQTLSKLLTQHSTTYPSLSHRIMKTLLLALISPGKSNGTREGAIRGLAGVGKEAIRKGLVEGGGAKVVAAEWESEGGGQHSTLLDSTIDALRVLRPESDMSDALDPSKSGDAIIIQKLQDTIGGYFTSYVVQDANWAKEILGLSNS
jgi:transcription initiation factor TFIID subunit 6